jgi:potassium efflux system protein
MYGAVGAPLTRGGERNAPEGAVDGAGAAGTLGDRAVSAALCRGATVMRTEVVGACRAFVLGLIGLAVCSAAWAQQDPLASPPELTVEAVEARVALITASADIGAEERQRLLDAYGLALERLKEGEARAAEAAAFSQAQQEAPERLAAVKALVAAGPGEPEPLPGDAPLEDLEQLRLQAEARLAAARDEGARVEADRQTRADRRLKVPELAAAATTELAAIGRDLEPAAAAAPSRDGAAQRTLLGARRRAVEAALDAYTKEIASYDARGELLQARKELAALQVGKAQAALDLIRETIAERQRAAARADARQVAADAAEVHPVLKPLAGSNRDLALHRAQQLLPRTDEAAERLRDVQAKVQSVKDDLAKVQARVAEAGMTKALALLLTERLPKLPDVSLYERSIAERQPKIEDAQLRLFGLEEELAEELGDAAAGALRLATAADAGLTAEERGRIEAAAVELLRTRRQLVEAEIGDYNKYLQTLGDLDYYEHQLVAAVEEYVRFVRRNVLWFRSTTPVGLRTVPQLVGDVTVVLNPGNWVDVLRALLKTLGRHPLFYFVAVVAFAVLQLLRPRIKRSLDRTGELAGSIHTDSMLHTLNAVVFTFLLCVPLPLLLGVVGLELMTLAEAADWARGVGVGTAATAAVLLTLNFVRSVCRKGGLAERQFRWRERPVQVMRVNVSLLVPVMVPTAFLVTMLRWLGAEAGHETVGRAAFIVAMAALALFELRVLRLEGGVLDEVLAQKRYGWLAQLRWLWFTGAVAVPVVLGLGAWAGYYHTVLEMTWRLVLTGWLCMGLVLVHGVLLRWLFVARRRIALEQARKRREAERAEAGEAAGPEGAVVEEPEVSLYTMSTQTRQLVNSVLLASVAVAVWFVWRDIVPALGVVTDIPIFSKLGVTVGSAVTALFILAVTAIAAKNVPGVLEMVALQHLPVEPGLRFAIATICRYAIAGVGAVMAFTALGIEWSEVQWLIAAMTVGLGFGLQEILANFVSGVIILFERPIRVGDTVTVGDVSGVVSRIRVRATTITSWDRKELIVPNKEFITGRLVNWSLSDRVLRIEVPVGIAYGSDTKLAERTLLRVAKENERVLEDPEPRVFFMSFGNSALTFELRVFVACVEDLFPARHELHMAIDAAFREARIEIAFPQQDVHVRSIHAALPVEERRKEE